MVFQEQMIDEVHTIVEQQAAREKVEDLIVFVSDEPPRVDWEGVPLASMARDGEFNHEAWAEVIQGAIGDTPLKLACVAAPTLDQRGDVNIGLVTMAPPLLFVVELFSLDEKRWERIAAPDALVLLAAPLRSNVVLHG